MNLKKIVRMCIILYISFTLTGCGLDELSVLSPPVGAAANEGSYLFSFTATSENNENALLGFELYYKFFNSSEDAANLKGLTSLTQLEVQRFKRLTKSDDYDEVIKPLFRYSGGNDKGDNITFAIDFSDPGGAFLSWSNSTDGTAGSFLVFRSIKDKENETFKVFMDNNTEDSDLSGLEIDPAQGDLYVALYVLSYGVENISTPLYSEPVWLYTVPLKED